MSAVLTVVTLALWTVAGSTPAEAAGTLRVVSWNIAGTSFHPDILGGHATEPDNRGTTGVAAKLVAQAAASRPAFITMNESCRAQAQYVVDRVSAPGGSTQWQFADSAGTDVLCGTNLDSGNAVIALGVSAVVARATYYFTDAAVITSSQTERSATCITVTFGATGRTVRGCSLHLHQTRTIAAAQAAAFVAALNAEGYPYPTVLAGDLNAEPGTLATTYAAFAEVDSPRNAATLGGSKIDYVFGDRGHFAATGTASVLEPPKCRTTGNWNDHVCSDHRIVDGTLTFVDSD